MVKKFFVLLLVVLVCSSAVFAGGNKEAESAALSDPNSFGAQVVKNFSGVEPTGVVASGFSMIANTFDTATGTFAMALSPFPSILERFYSEDPTTMNGSFEKGLQSGSITPSNSLLISEGYYSEAEENAVTITVGGHTFTGKTPDMQKKSWNMISLLFMVFFAAEIIFSTIYGYLTDRDTSVLKDVITKGVLCILLYLLVSALPFLIEGFRVGFFMMARTITGIDSVNAPAGSARALMVSRMQNSTVFEYPGLLIRNLSYTIENLDPENVGGINLYDYVDMPGWDWLTGFFVRLFYLFIKIIASILIIFTAFHVMLNVCEVYLLLGITACVTPFVVFSPLKFLGEKAVMSLFSNMMELFVIIVVIFSTFMVTDAITANTLAKIQVTYKTATFKFSNINANNFEAAFGEEWPFSEGTKVPEEGFEFNMYLADGKSANDYNAVDTTFNEARFIATPRAKTAIRRYVNDTFDSIKEEIKKGTSTVKLQAWSTEQAASGNTVAEINKEFENLTIYDLPMADKFEVFDYIGMQLAPTLIKVESIGDKLSGDGDFDVLLIHILTGLLCIFMQTYFVNQSSQITNAILSGNVSAEGFTAAMGKWAAAKAGGAMFRRAGSAAKAGALGAGAAAGTIVGKTLNKTKTNMEEAGKSGTTGHKIVSHAANVANKASTAAGQGAKDAAVDTVTGKPGGSAQKRAQNTSNSTKKE